MPEPPSTLTLQPGYHEPRNTVLRPEQVLIYTRYFFERWAPRLGPERTQLVLVLRDLAQQHNSNNEATPPSRGAAALQLTSATLAARLGLTEKQVQALLRSEPLSEEPVWRQLALPESGTYKLAGPNQVLALRCFIPRLRYSYERVPGEPTPRRTGFIIEIALDDPLTPEDQARVNANFGVDAAARERQNLLSRPVNANFGAQPTDNLTLTEANASGAAACALSSALTAAPGPAPVARQPGVDSDPGNAPSRPVPGTAVAPSAAPSWRPPEHAAAPESSPPRTVDLQLPLPQLRARALADLRRQRKRAARVAIVTQFAGRLTGLGIDAAGLPRTTPERTDYARVGELCQNFGAESVLTQLFVIAGRLPDTTSDPLAYLRSSLEHQRQRGTQAAPTSRGNGGAPAYGAGVSVDQFDLTDYTDVPGGEG